MVAKQAGNRVNQSLVDFWGVVLDMVGKLVAQYHMRRIIRPGVNEYVRRKLAAAPNDARNSERAVVSRYPDYLLAKYPRYSFCQLELILRASSVSPRC